MAHKIKKAGYPALLKFRILDRLDRQCHAEGNNYSQQKRAVYHHSAQ